jgi:uncharacterized ion transporter superfamily protein YfcC
MSWVLTGYSSHFTRYYKIIIFVKKKEMALLRTLLILIIIFYVVRLFTRYIIPGLFSNYMESKMKEFSRQQQKYKQQEHQKSKQKEGEVRIDYTPEDRPKNKHSRGEYTDYVEVKD